MIRRPRPPSLPSSIPARVPTPPRGDDGIAGAVRRTKKLGRSGAKGRQRRIVDKVKGYLNNSSPDIRDVPPAFEGSIYGDDDESEN
jgi:hypothetical protein